MMDALLDRINEDKAKIQAAFAAGKLPAGVRGLDGIGIDLVDYSSPIEGLTDDEVTLLRNTIHWWLSKAKHELPAV